MIRHSRLAYLIALGALAHAGPSVVVIDDDPFARKSPDREPPRERNRERTSTTASPPTHRRDQLQAAERILRAAQKRQRQAERQAKGMR